MNFFGKNISGKFTIPSGIVTTSIDSIRWVMKNIHEIGIITTKSIGPVPRSGNREPLYLEHTTGSYMNAVGLANPGVDSFLESLDELEIPEDKFLLCSIFGGNFEEFIEVAKKLVEKVDGFELNVSCPHAEGHGQSIGENFELVGQIVKEVKKLGKPVLVKLSPNVSPISEIVKICEDNGIDGFVAINTVGPGLFTVDGNPVLTNKIGGMSGNGVLPIGLKVIKEIRDNTSLPILACGGISKASDIVAYEKVGAEFFGVGSAITGMDSQDLITYFLNLQKDLEESTKTAIPILKKDVKMEYTKMKITKKVDLSDDLVFIQCDGDFQIGFGQYVFLWIPEIGEKPFSAYYCNPLSFLIQKVGKFTSHVMNLKEGDEVYVRGPNGKALPLSGKILALGGGSGIASFGKLIEKNYGECMFLFGVRSKGRIPDIEKFKEKGELVLFTDDGTAGEKGFVTSVLEEKIKEFQPDVVLNCGPPMMVKIAEEIEKKLLSNEKIFSSVDKITKCGVGICGSCVREDGLRTCVDGPFLNPL